jgi:hypothetical protein
MWIISDEAMHSLLGGNYDTVIYLKQKDDSLTVRDLFCIQFCYASYDGFRKFYNKKLKSIIKDIKHLNNTSLLGNMLRFFIK